MTNWRTTGAAIATAAFGFVLFSPQYFAHWPWMIDLAKYATLGGLVSIGIAAKDAAVHSTADEVVVATDKEAKKATEKALNAANGN